VLKHLIENRDDNDDDDNIIDNTAADNNATETHEHQRRSNYRDNNNNDDVVFSNNPPTNNNNNNSNINANDSERSRKSKKAKHIDNNDNNNNNNDYERSNRKSKNNDNDDNDERGNAAARKFDKQVWSFCNSVFICNANRLRFLKFERATRFMNRWFPNALLRNGNESSGILSKEFHLTFSNNNAEFVAQTYGQAGNLSFLLGIWEHTTHN
jgi:hypothetical protein